MRNAPFLGDLLKEAYILPRRIRTVKGNHLTYLTLSGGLGSYYISKSLLGLWGMKEKITLPQISKVVKEKMEQWPILSDRSFTCFLDFYFFFFLDWNFQFLLSHFSGFTLHITCHLAVPLFEKGICWRRELQKWRDVLSKSKREWKMTITKNLVRIMWWVPGRNFYRVLFYMFLTDSLLSTLCMLAQESNGVHNILLSFCGNVSGDWKN